MLLEDVHTSMLKEVTVSTPEWSSTVNDCHELHNQLSMMCVQLAIGRKVGLVLGLLLFVLYSSVCGTNYTLSGCLLKLKLECKTVRDNVT